MIQDPSPARPRDALSPANLHLLQTVARLGSMAAAAAELGLVPSALSYRVRQMEEALDVLLFDRRSRQARLTPAGAELLRAGEPLLRDLDALAQRVKRVATGWEPQFTVAADALIAHATLFELCADFYALQAPTRLRLRAETLSGTWEALQHGQADLALGVGTDITPPPGISLAELGKVSLVFVVAPGHPLCALPEPLDAATLRAHRAVAVADSTLRGQGLSVGLQLGQDVLTVPSMQHKLEAQLRGLGAGFLPEPLARSHLQSGRLVARRVQQAPRAVVMGYAWRHTSPSQGMLAPTVAGRALAWWLQRLQAETTRRALLEHHVGV